MTSPHTAPPFDDYAEKAVLGAVLADEKAANIADGILVPDDFYVEPHRLIFSACRGLLREGSSADLVTVTNRLRDTGKLDAAGGPVAVSNLLDDTPDIDHVSDYCRIVKDKARRREAVATARRAITFSAEGKPLAGVRNQLKSGLEALAEPEALEKPDLSIVNGYRKPAPEFHPELFGEWERWIINAAETAGAPPDYVGCGLLALWAGTIGNAAETSPWPGWREPALLWVGVVGDPGSSKSPALDALRKALVPIERECFETHKQSLKNWESESRIAKVSKDLWEKDCRARINAGGAADPMPKEAREPEKPLLRRIRIGDATPEAIAVSLHGEPRGLLLERDELAGWLGSFGRYTGAAAGERALWLEAYGARGYTVDRVKAGHMRIPRLSVSILGTAQPERLNKLMLQSEDDGLVSRFLWTWPEEKQERRRPERMPDVERLTAAIRWFRSLPMQKNDEGELEPMVYYLRKEAAALYESWWGEQQKDLRAASGLMKSALAKGPGVVLRLSLVLALADGAFLGELSQTDIGEAVVARAIALWEEYFSPMAERVFGDASLPQATRDARAVTRLIVKTRPEKINARKLRRSGDVPELKKDAARTDAALEELVEAGWLIPTPSRRGGLAGRERKDFTLSPELLKALDRGEP